MTFQEVIFALEQFWAHRGCVIEQPYDVEVGAGTMCPATFLRVLGPEPWLIGYVQPSRRADDGRYVAYIRPTHHDPNPSAGARAAG